MQNDAISVALWRARGFALEAIPVPRLSQGFLSFLAGIALTSIDLPARVRPVQSGVEVLAVVRERHHCLESANKVVALVHQDASRSFCRRLVGLRSEGLAPCSMMSFSSLVKCCFGARTSVASMPQSHDDRLPLVGKNYRTRL